jgi:DNA-binding LacI/PurR family transcriptional regulator
VYQVPGGNPEHGLAGAEYFLNLSVRPTAIVCFNDLIATGVIKTLHTAGLDVPADISVTGFDNIGFSAYTTPPLTTFDQPKRFIGMKAARLLLGLLDRAEMEPSGPTIQILQGTLLIRASTAPPSTV